MTLTEQRKGQLDEIVDMMNKEAELKLYYDKGTSEWKHCNDVLESLKAYVMKLEEHERTYVEMGLMDHQDIHDVYWPDKEVLSEHERRKRADKKANEPVTEDKMSATMMRPD